mgnify:CR=1 FL=1
MKNRWLYQHGSFVVICRDRLEISLQKHPLNFSQNFEMKWEGNFPELVNLSIHQRIDGRTSLGYFFHNWDPLYGLLWHFWNFEGYMREISKQDYPWWFSREKKGKYPRRKFSFISPEFLQRNYEEISTGMISWKSPIIPCENLGDVDGLPAGLRQTTFTFVHNDLLPELVDMLLVVESKVKAIIKVMVPHQAAYKTAKTTAEKREVSACTSCSKVILS